MLPLEILILISVYDLILSGMEHKLLPCHALTARCLKDSKLSAAHGKLVPVEAAHTAQWELSKQHVALFFINHREEKDQSDVFLIGGDAQRAEFCLPKI